MSERMPENKIGEIFCEIFDFEDDEKHGEVRLNIGKCDDEFKILMMAAEFLTHLVAQKSDAGYEKALDLIRQGAMTYVTEISENEEKFSDDSKNNDNFS